MQSQGLQIKARHCTNIRMWFTWAADNERQGRAKNANRQTSKQGGGMHGRMNRYHVYNNDFKNSKIKFFPEEFTLPCRYIQSICGESK